MTQTNISVYVDPEIKLIIERASKIVGLKQSTFCRVSALKEANNILKNEVDQNGANKN